MLKVENICFRYSKFSRPVLNGACLELQPGEIGILLGKNGSGKTTLFKNILGIHKPGSGRILFEGEDLLKMSRKALQNGFRLPPASETGFFRAAAGRSSPHADR